MVRMKAALPVIAATLALAMPAGATCVDNVCVPGPPGSISNEGSGDPGTCMYESDTRPWDWQGNDDGPPYIFWRTKAWGLRYPYPTHWDVQICDIWPGQVPTVVCHVGPIECPNVS
jgi:hypothetical protein